MRLADFILRDMEAILVAWEAFAADQLPAARNMKPLALRDHAREILQAVAKDLSTSQSREAQTSKSLGRAPVFIGAHETAAQTHALLRAHSGFDINQLAAEYRALRASILRLWRDDSPSESTHLNDIIRFNEAIDQALAESVAFFSGEVDQARNLFLGMLGHDLRSPLQTIQMTASYLSALNAGDKVSEAARRLIASGHHMQALLDDLVDFNRTKFGLGINITPGNVDLSKLCASAVDQLRAANPGRRIELEVQGDTCGSWDSQRLQQVLGNLVRNAIKYGAPDAPVYVSLNGDDAGVVLEVRNSGPAIAPSDLDQIFDPLRRGSNNENNENKREADGSLGLGLYIVREIAKGHGGAIEVRSNESQTVFAVRLPRTRE
jgi:signal transduction histidine kinase